MLAIYTLIYDSKVKRGWAILHDAQRIADVRTPYQDTRIADRADERITAYHEKRAARRIGAPWPLCEDCKSDDHHEGRQRGVHIAQKMYRCACPCGVKYPRTKRTCWCSGMRLRNSVRQSWRWLPVSLIRKLHEWHGKYTCCFAKDGRRYIDDA